MPASHRVELSPAAQRQARRLAARDARQVQEALRSLVADARPAGSVKLAGFATVWRIRAGRLRIIYEIHAEEERLMVLRIARRDERTYRNL